MNKNAIEYLTLSQEDLVKAGAFDVPMAIQALKKGLFKYQEERILFPDKIVQIFNDETQERINCLPATLLDEKICGVKWVSVFPPNPAKYGFILRSNDLYPVIPAVQEVIVKGNIKSWADFAKSHGITFRELREANHWIRWTELTNKNKRSYKVQIPDKNALRYNPAETKAHNPNWVIE